MAPCACNTAKKNSSASAKSYVVTLPSGGKQTYRTEVEAIAAAKRTNGTWRAQ